VEFVEFVGSIGFLGFIVCGETVLGSKFEVLGKG